MKNSSQSELRYGGLFLSLGALVTIVCILLEVNAGWASLLLEMKRTDYEAGKFLYENWDEMSVIWNWSLFGNVFLAIASILLLKNSKQTGWFPTSLIWSIYFMGSLLLIISFAMSLGSYYKALEVIDEQTYLFEIMRGTPLYLFNIGALFGFSILAIYFQQGFIKQGVVPRGYAIITLIFILSAFILAFLGLVSFTVFVITYFLIPFLLGIFYFRATFAKAI